MAMRSQKNSGNVNIDASRRVSDIRMRKMPGRQIRSTSRSTASTHTFAMSRIPETPRAQSKGLDPKTPTGARPTAVQSSPHYATARRHSLYGTEDRVVLDPGSRVWKVGFSGEGRPRDVQFVGEQDKTSLWSLSRPSEKAAEEEEERILEAKIQQRLRTVFHQFALCPLRCFILR